MYEATVAETPRELQLKDIEFNENPTSQSSLPVINTETLTIEIIEISGYNQKALHPQKSIPEINEIIKIGLTNEVAPEVISNRCKSIAKAYDILLQRLPEDEKETFLESLDQREIRLEEILTEENIEQAAQDFHESYLSSFTTLRTRGRLE